MKAIAQDLSKLGWCTAPRLPPVLFAAVVSSVITAAGSSFTVDAKTCFTACVTCAVDALMWKKSAPDSETHSESSGSTKGGDGAARFTADGGGGEGPGVTVVHGALGTVDVNTTGACVGAKRLYASANLERGLT